MTLQDLLTNVYPFNPKLKIMVATDSTGTSFVDISEIRLDKIEHPPKGNMGFKNDKTGFVTLVLIPEEANDGL